jgi:hypothetical protein
MFSYYFRLGVRSLRRNPLLTALMVLTRFYKLAGGNQYGASEDFFIPFSSAVRHESPAHRNLNCSAWHDPGFANVLASDCAA